MRRLEDKTFLTLVAAVSIAFAMIIVPFFGAILWALIAAIVFFPLKKRLLRGNYSSPCQTGLSVIHPFHESRGP